MVGKLMQEFVLPKLLLSVLHAVTISAMGSRQLYLSFPALQGVNFKKPRLRSPSLGDGDIPQQPSELSVLLCLSPYGKEVKEEQAPSALNGTWLHPAFHGSAKLRVKSCLASKKKKKQTTKHSD